MPGANEHPCSRATTDAEPADGSPGRELARLQRLLPLVTDTFTIAGRPWRLTYVRDQDRLLDGAEIMCEAPYGCLLWESALALAAWLAEAPALVRGRRVLELGAGVGLVGHVAAHLGGEVCQTDHLSEALSLALHNARQNALPEPRQLAADWRAFDHGERYDVILGADILYSPDLHDDLRRIFERNLAPGGTLLLADPCRPYGLDLVSRMEEAGWIFDIAMTEAALPGAEGPMQPVAIVTGRRRVG
jgi:predicted nicotinamide N-methyase